MKLKKLFCIALATLMTAGCTFMLTGCDNSSASSTGDADSDNSSRPSVNADVKHDTVNKVGYQLEMPKDGEEIAILHTSMGDITWRFFPENAPKAVENFITLAKEGKYDNTIFHRVIDDFMIQGGDYENFDGTGGTSAFGSAFEDEFCDTLYNIRGSVAMANSGVNTNGSQFFINQSGADSFDASSIDYDATYEYYTQVYNQWVQTYGTSFVAQFQDADSFINDYIGGISPLSYAISDEVMELYKANGGNIHLDGALRSSGGHTVFAQVIDGMDVVDAIAAVEVNSDDNKPVEDVILESVEITTYKAQ